MINMSNMQWSAKRMAKMINEGKLSFDHVVQRGLVWDLERKSLLIQTMMIGFPIPAFYFSKEDELYYALDGKQRGSTIKEYLADEFALHENTPCLVNENNEEVNVAGYKYSELTEDLQDAIKEKSLTIYYVENMSEEQKADMFYRLNNGRTLTAIEHTRVKMSVLPIIQKMAQHEVVSKVVTDRGRIRYNDENLVMQVYAIQNFKDVSFENKVFRKEMIGVKDISLEQQDRIGSVFNKINSIHINIMDVVEHDLAELDVMDLLKEEKKAAVADINKKKRIAKKVITRTHFVSLAYVLDKIDITTDEAAKLVMSFFTGGKETSIDKYYNDASGSGSAQAPSIRARKESILKHFTK